MPQKRRLGRALAGFVAIHFGLIAGGADEPVKMREFKVAADVPLVKVGQFPMLERRFGAAAVAQDHFIYIIAGSPGDDAMSDTVERFDTQTGKSEIFTHLHIPRFWHQAVLVGDQIYVIGGSVIGAPLPDDPKLAEGIARHRGGAAHAQGSAPIASVEIIDLKTRAVSAGVSLPRAVSGFGCVAFGGQIAVIGGKPIDKGADHVDRAVTNRVNVFDPEKQRWLQAPSMPTPRSDGAAAACGPFIIVPGGYNYTESLDVVEVHDLRTGKWHTVRPLCRPSSSHSVVVVDKFMFLFGDYNNPGELLAYDLFKETSETFTLGYTPARHTAAVVVDRKIYVIGGRTAAGDRPLDAIQVFALRKDLNATAQNKAPAAAAAAAAPAVTQFARLEPAELPPATTIDEPLRTELRAILQEDQKYRRQIDEVEKQSGRDSPAMKDLWKAASQADAENLAKVKAILDTRGWLGPEVVGADGNSALFLVIQHADIATQEKYLPMMRAAVNAKKARASDLALLEDRVALREGRRQIYGSQIRLDPQTGQYELSPLADPDTVDQRRASVGLPPLADYVKHWGLTWDANEYKKTQPPAEKAER